VKEGLPGEGEVIFTFGIRSLISSGRLNERENEVETRERKKVYEVKDRKEILKALNKGIK
jgi:hypothetical protein